MVSVVIKIALTSDTHHGAREDGVTTANSLLKMFRRMAEQKPDLVIHAGDFSGKFSGEKSVEVTCRFMREAMPDTPILAVMGNHDLWCRTGDGVVSADDFYWNYDLIVNHFSKHKIHFLDMDGFFVHAKAPQLQFIGHTLWYGNANPPTNDKHNLPIGMNGDTNHMLYKDHYDTAVKNLAAALPGKEIVWISHFPVVELRDNSLDTIYGGSAAFGVKLTVDYGVRRFFNGHAHQLHKGPRRFEAGSDYGNPKFLVVELE